MAVPTHDTRDFAFAKKYKLPLKVVISPKDKTIVADELTDAYTEEGVLVNSNEFDGMSNEKAKKAITQKAVDEGFGEFKTQYRLRDWLISRQRYWGAPIPVVYCDKCGIQPVPEDQLPVMLPKTLILVLSVNPRLQHLKLLQLRLVLAVADLQDVKQTQWTLSFVQAGTI